MGHILYPNFGKNGDPIGYLTTLVERVAASRPKGIKGYAVDLLLREAEVDQFQLANLDDPNQPLALLTLSPKEGVHTLWPLQARIRQYKDYEIGKEENGGLTLPEFLNLPRSIVEFLIAERRENMEMQEQIRRQAENKQKQEDKAGGTLGFRPPNAKDFIP